MIKHSRQSESVFYFKVRSLIFCFLLLIGGLLFFLLPRQQISMDEKRLLTPFPSYTVQKLFDGRFTDSLDLFYSDNFIFRNRLIAMATWMRSIRGYTDNEIQFYDEGVTDDKKSGPGLLPQVKDSTLADQPLDMPYENLKSIIIANNRAIQMFAGSRYAAEKYAGLLKLYQEAFSDTLNIFCMPIPVGSDYYLPAKINQGREREYINFLQGYLPAGVKLVNAYEALRLHKQEYIQFNTDHHWTGLGAYYAYCAFCQSAGLEPISIDQMTRRVIPNFLGTLYYRTRSEALKNNPDSVIYHKIPFETSTTYFKSGILRGAQGMLYVESAKGVNSYGVFLGSDYPLMRVVSPVRNGRKIAIFKDSYGNAFAHYLASHYEEVFIVDYRYFNDRIRDLVRHYGITDMLFAHNVYVLNSEFTITREKGFLSSKQVDTPNKKP